jgi:hypothetical protein
MMRKAVNKRFVFICLGATTMFEWWVFLWYLTFLGTYLGGNFGDMGLIWGGLVGYCIGAIIPAGPGPLTFDPNDI